MFVVSVTKNKIKKSLAIGIAVLFISFLLVWVLCFFGKSQDVHSGTEPSVNAASIEEQLKFVSHFGWEVDEEPIDVREVIIPETFDEVYTAYNQIQIKQGYNLEKYAGQRVKRWSYVIRNYPETSPQDDFIRINLLVCDNVIIGGDVCSVKLDGFMHGFYKV